MLSEKEVRERIEYLEVTLINNEELYSLSNTDSYTDYEVRRKILMKCYNIESQLDALYYVLGEKYIYRHM